MTETNTSIDMTPVFLDIVIAPINAICPTTIIKDPANNEMTNFTVGTGVTTCVW
jgi:hypothetical protein